MMCPSCPSAVLVAQPCNFLVFLQKWRASYLSHVFRNFQYKKYHLVGLEAIARTYITPLLSHAYKKVGQVGHIRQTVEIVEKKGVLVAS
jgi:hypothetical protein